MTLVRKHCQEVYSDVPTLQSVSLMKTRKRSHQALPVQMDIFTGGQRIGPKRLGTIGTGKLH